MTHTYNEITGTTLEILERLNTIEYGEHVILIYPNYYTSREIYSHFCETALKNNEIVLLLTYYETTSAVRQTLKEIDIDVEKYERENVLIIEDITKTYFGSIRDFLSFLKVFDKQQEKLDKNGLSVIADMGVFFHFQNNKDALMNFESSLLSKVKRICNYHIGDFSRFEEYEKHDLAEKHNRVMIVAP